jgi:tRNA (guanine-N7-)-methyltransferase
MTDSLPPRRTIRSFVKRTGRVTPSQERALSDLWPRYGIDYEPDLLDLDAVFGRHADRVLEIGFGNGDTLVQAAADNTEIDYIGLEVHDPGVGHCLLKARDKGISNLRVIVHDAIDVLRDQVADGTLSRINLYFPDPWPKKRHHKRRIINVPFLALAATKLRPGGTLHIATDWENYAEYIDETVSESTEFRLAERREHLGDRPLDRYTTKFETRGLKIGHRIWDWRFQRTGPATI